MALLVVAPAALASWLEKTCSPESEWLFAFFAQCVALFPGYPGVCLRRAFYVLTLERCSHDCFIGFGSLFSHRQAEVEQGVYIGNFTAVGCARLRQGCLIGSQVSLLSGPALHEPDPTAGWLPFDPLRLRRLDIGANCWIGERAVVMSDVGSRAMVAAGAVVSSAVPAGIMVAGNPARYVRRVHAEEPPAAQQSPAAVDHMESAS